MQIFEGALLVDGIDPLAHCVRNGAETGVEDVEDRLVKGLERGLLAAFSQTFLTAFLTAFLTTFLATFLTANFLKESNMGHGVSG